MSVQIAKTKSEFLLVYPTEAEAYVALEVLAQVEFINNVLNVAVNCYNALPDKAGDPPNQAGQVALDDMIQQIRDFASSQSWPNCP